MADLTDEQRRAVAVIASEAFGHCDYWGTGHQSIEDALAVLGMTPDDVDWSNRPHGPLGGQTPYERLRAKARDPLS